MSIYSKTRETLNKQCAKIIASIGNEVTRSQVFLDLIGEQIDLADSLYNKKMNRDDIGQQMTSISNAIATAVEAEEDSAGKKVFSNDLKRKIENTARLSNDTAYQSLLKQYDIATMDIDDYTRCLSLYGDLISFVKHSGR